MDKAVRIFKNSKMFNYVIIVELKDKKVEEVDKVNKIVKLLNNDKVIGLNIFDNSLFKDADDGFIYPNKENLEVLNQYFKNNKLDLTLNYNKDEYLKVAEVTKVSKVENSDNLNLCEVNIEDKQYSIICGASNVKEGMKTIAALDKAILPDGKMIEAGEVLGVYSQGMLCSLKELGLDPEHKVEGIVELANDEEVGKSFFEVDWRKYDV